MLVCISRAADGEHLISGSVARLYYSAMPLAAGQTFAGYTIVRLLGCRGHGRGVPGRPSASAPAGRAQGAARRRVRRRRVPAAVQPGSRHRRDAVASAHRRCPRPRRRRRPDLDLDGLRRRDGRRASCCASATRTGMPKEEVLEIVTVSRRGARLRASARPPAPRRQAGQHHADRPCSQASSEFCLGDFGIARRVDDSSNLTATNMTVGTVFYAAPEQLMGEDLDGRADQYALAATAFHLLIGIAAVSPLQPDGGHQPAPHRVAAGPRRPASRVVGARSGIGQGAFEGPQGPVQQLRGLREGAGAPTRGRTGRSTTNAPRPQSRSPPTAAAGRHEVAASAGGTTAPAIIVPAILAALLLVAIALVLIQFREIERLMNDDYTPPPSPSVTSPRAESPPQRPVCRRRRSPLRLSASPAVAVVGANCSPVGAPQPPPTATPSTARLCSQRAPPSGRSPRARFLRRPSR